MSQNQDQLLLSTEERRRRLGKRQWLISNKGTQSPTECLPSAYAQRIFGYSAAPSMGPSLVSPIWGLIAEELERYQRRSLGWVAKARRTRHANQATTSPFA